MRSPRTLLVSRDIMLSYNNKNKLYVHELQYVGGLYRTTLHATVIIEATPLHFNLEREHWFYMSEIVLFAFSDL